MKQYFWIDLSGMSQGLILLSKVTLTEDDIARRESTLQPDVTLIRKTLGDHDIIVLVETPFFMAGFDNYLNHLCENYVKDLTQPTLFELISPEIGDCDCN